MAFKEATKRRHRASTYSDITQSDMPTPDFGGIFHRQIDKKGLRLTLRPQLPIGDEKHISKTIGYLVARLNSIKLLNNLIAITYHLTRISLLIATIGHRKTLKMLYLRVVDPPRLGPYHGQEKEMRS